MPFFLEAASCRGSLAVTSRSNWALDSSMLSVSRPMEVVALNCWVRAKETFADRTPRRSGEVIEGAGQAVDLVDYNCIDAVRFDVGQQP